MIPSPFSAQAAAAAHILLETRSVLIAPPHEPFTYTSGRKGPVYVDCRRLISFPAQRTALMDMAADRLRSLAVDFIAGGETAGIPYAAFIAERLNAPMLYVRKQPKGFGRMAQIEGCMDESGKRVLLVEDLQTDGGSKKIFVDALRTAGAVVTDAFVIFHYGIYAQSAENMASMGITLHALCTWWDVLAAATAEGRFDAPTLNALQDFLNQPDGWAERHGHASARA